MQRPLLPIFTAAALTFAIYAALVQFMPLKIEKGQNQRDTNMLRVENYLAKPDPEIVLVGSSLTFRLPPPLLGSHIANLAIAGGAPATGLALIEQSNGRPKLVLVEVNLLTLSADTTAVKSELRFPERQLREGVHAFRAGFDPVNVVERTLQALLHKADEDLVPQPDAVHTLIADQQRAMSRPPDAGALNSKLALVEAQVSRLQARGTRIGFFEMPIDPSLTELPAEKILRQAAMQRFPPSHFCWLNLSLPGGVHTLDGIHLMSGDAAKVARQVANQATACLRP